MQPEDYLAPKQLPSAIRELFGLSVSYRDIHRIRRASVNDGLFVAGCARASEVFHWLKSHPEFTSRVPARTVVIL